MKKLALLTGVGALMLAFAARPASACYFGDGCAWNWDWKKFDSYVTINKTAIADQDVDATANTGHNTLVSTDGGAYVKNVDDDATVYSNSTTQNLLSTGDALNTVKASIMQNIADDCECMPNKVKKLTINYFSKADQDVDATANTGFNTVASETLGPTVMHVDDLTLTDVSTTLNGLTTGMAKNYVELGVVSNVQGGLTP